jgi:flagellar M-ring protein FliF
MRDQLTGRLRALQRGFGAFSPAQKAIVGIGGVLVLLAGFFVFRWASTPTYAPLFSNLAAADASAIVEQLEADGTPYKLGEAGATILVPRADVYDERIKISGKGLPSDGSSGYEILDKQDLSTSQFQEQTGYKRAMEGELQKTIEALDAVETAVVHLAIPPKELFADEKQPTTASVLVKTRPGTSLEPEQIQAVVHLVASSVEGLDPKQVTVADASGRVLSASGDGVGAIADTRSQQVKAFETKVTDSVQRMLDKVLGAGNAAVQITADLNFDKTVTNTKRYFTDPDMVPLSDTKLTESYTAPGTTGTGGAVGPDTTPNASKPSTPGNATNYRKEQQTSDNAVGETNEQREAAPGSVRSLHVGVIVDKTAAGGVSTDEIETLVSSALGIDAKRGDTVAVQSMAFDHSAQEAAAKELATAKAADDRAALMNMLKTAGLILVVAGLFFAAWLRSRRRARARDKATSYVVEQIRARDALDHTQVVPLAPADPAPLELDPSVIEQANLRAAARDEIAAMVERQPEEVAQLLRGWLVDADRSA